MLQHHLAEIFDREIEKIRTELVSYSQEAHLWQHLPGTSNSAGNLILHLCGNLRHFIGATLGHSGYVRNRDLEFGSPPVPVAELQQLITATRSEVAGGLAKVTDASLDEVFPKDVGGQTRTTRFVLLHLLGHLTYHLGQINYHRRYYSANKR
jgi:uncharacterized damage-inducible protein DinB